MSEFDAMFEQPMDARSKEELAQLSGIRWEAAVVGRLLHFYGVEHLGPALKKRCQETTGNYRLLFTWFQDRFPDFPVWLVFRKVRYLHKLTMEDFMDRFTKTTIYEAFQESKESVPEWWLEAGKPFGMVFEFIHGMGGAIFTNCERPMGESDTRITKFIRGKGHWLQPLDEFLRSLGWRPGD